MTATRPETTATPFLGTEIVIEAESIESLEERVVQHKRSVFGFKKPDESQTGRFCPALSE